MVEFDSEEIRRGMVGALTGYERKLEASRRPFNDHSMREQREALEQEQERN